MMGRFGDFESRGSGGLKTVKARGLTKEDFVKPLAFTVENLLCFWMKGLCRFSIKAIIAGGVTKKTGAVLLNQMLFSMQMTEGWVK